MNFNTVDIIANRYMMTAKTILLVEDDESIREFVGAFFEDEGYSFTTAVNGVEALKVVARLRPSLILLDMYMPLMDGRAFAAAYRELPGPHAPLIGMSANVPDEELPPYFEGFLVKPFDLDELLACIERYLQQDTR